MTVTPAFPLYITIVAEGEQSRLSCSHRPNGKHKKVSVNDSMFLI